MNSKSNGDEFDPTNLQLSSEQVAQLEAVKRKRRMDRYPRTRKRGEAFVKVPWWWWDKLRNERSGHAVWLAPFLLYESFHQRKRTFKLSNGLLCFDGVSRSVKYRALEKLEALGLISVDRQSKKSPLVTLNLDPPSA